MTTIAYDRPIADYVDALSKTGHVTHTRHVKKSVTFHHNGGNLSLRGIYEVWKVREASAHFQSDSKGALGQYVHVNEYAWATGNTRGNQETISIEMANSSYAPDWVISQVTWMSAARLAGWLFVNVIKTNPTASNVHVHSYWKSTVCAGPYIDKIFPALLAEIKKWYAFFKGGSKPSPIPAPIPVPVPTAEEKEMGNVNITVQHPDTNKPWLWPTALWSIWFYVLQAARDIRQVLAIVQQIAAKVDIDKSETDAIAVRVKEEFDKERATEPVPPTG